MMCGPRLERPVPLVTLTLPASLPAPTSIAKGVIYHAPTRRDFSIPPSESLLQALFYFTCSYSGTISPKRKARTIAFTASGASC